MGVVEIEGVGLRPVGEHGEEGARAETAADHRRLGLAARGLDHGVEGAGQRLTSPADGRAQPVQQAEASRLPHRGRE